MHRSSLSDWINCSGLGWHHNCFPLCEYKHMDCVISHLPAAWTFLKNDSVTFFIRDKKTAQLSATSFCAIAFFLFFLTGLQALKQLCVFSFSFLFFQFAGVTQVSCLWPPFMSACHWNISKLILLGTQASSSSYLSHPLLSSSSTVILKVRGEIASLFTL